MVRITGIAEKTVPLSAGNIQNAYVSFSEMTTSVVAISTDVMQNGIPVVGYGFNSNGRYGAAGPLRERFIPRLMRAHPAALLDVAGTNLDPERAWAIMMTNEKPGGHGDRGVAVGALDMALWDLVAKLEDRPLYRVLSDRYNNGEHCPDVYVYAAGGYYTPDKTVKGLQAELKSYLDQGFESVKIKVGGVPLEDDLRRIEAALEVVGSGERLAVDVNGRFDLETALSFGDAIAQYGLKWYEEAGDPLDYRLQAVLAEHYPGPLATGENLFSMSEVQNLIRYGGMRPDRDYLQFDCALSYGFVEYIRTIRMIERHGWDRKRCIPHGGHAMSLHIAAGLGLAGNEAYPDVFAPFGAFSDGTAPDNGVLRISEDPGIGFERNTKLFELLTQVAP